MFGKADTFYYCGFTVASDADFKTLYDLLVKHENVMFKVIETEEAKVALGDFKHERLQVVPYSTKWECSKWNLQAVNCVLDDHDKDYYLIHNKGSITNAFDFNKALGICIKLGFSDIHTMEVYATNILDEKKMIIVQKGRDFEAYTRCFN